MGQPQDKWFSMRTDFFSRDAYELGFFNLSPQAMALYVASAAYASRWGIDHCFASQAAYVGIKRPAPVIRELVEGGFYVRSLTKGQFHVAHEGTLWRRGTPLQRRSIPIAIRAAVMKRDDYACVNCGNPNRLTLDHIWPYSKGGQDTIENLRVLCRSCNSQKGARVDAS